MLPAMLIFVAMTFFWPLNKLCVVTSVPCHDLALSSLDEFCVATKFLCRNTVFVVRQFGPRRDNFLWSLSVCVATTLSCCDLTVFPFTGFCVATSISCRDLAFSSLAEFGVATSFSCCDQAVIPFIEFYVATSFLCRDLIFVSRHHFCC